MLINLTYPTRITYILDTSNLKNPLEPFGKKTTKKIKSGLIRLEKSNYRFKFESLTEDLLEKFIPLYEANIKSKANGIVFNLKQRLIYEKKHEFPFEMLNLFKGIDYVGGLIFSNRQSFLTTAYKFFPKEIEIPLPISIAYLSEYYLNLHAIENKVKFIKRGKDRNLFGSQNASSIGLTLFKILCGYRPWIPLEGTIDLEFENSYEWDEKSDVLIYEGSKFDTAVPQITLCTVDLNSVDDKYGVLNLKAEQGMFKFNIIASTKVKLN